MARFRVTLVSSMLPIAVITQVPALDVMFM